MPRFEWSDADKYGSKGGKGAFFQLKDDGDKAKVHILGDDMKDFPGYAVHRVPVGDGHKYINCLREAGEPVDVCPFCALGKSDPELSKVHVKLFIPLYNIDADEIQIWERGKTFFKTLGSYIAHTPHVSKAVTEIERQGEKNDQKTTYGLYEMRDEDDGFDIENIREDIPDIFDDGYVLEKSANDMEYYIDRGEFPGSEDSGNVRRRSDARDSGRDCDERTASRRTPSRRRSEDEY